jgi:hypothetical protein
MIIFRVLTGRSWVKTPTSAGPAAHSARAAEMSTVLQFSDPDDLRSTRDEEAQIEESKAVKRE